MKKIILSLGIILLIGIVAGAVVSFNLTRVTYEPTITLESDKDLIEFKCDGIDKSLSKYEKNWDENDLLNLAKSNCTGTITDIKKGSDYWRSNDYGLKSFNEDELKADACKYSEDNKTAYDDKTKLCIEPVAQIGNEI